MSACVSRIGAVLWAVCALNLLAVNIHAQESQTPEEIIAGSEALDESTLVLGEDPPETAAPASAVSVRGIFRVLLTLAVVAAAIYGLVFFVKRAGRLNRTQDPFLKVLASVPLGTNRSAHIISVGSQAWLVGAAENGVNLISEIGDKDILNAMFLDDSRKSASDEKTPAGRMPDFRTLLSRLGKPVESAAPSPENIRKRSERLKGL